MTVPTQIVLATDFSQASMSATPVAVELARIFRGRMTLLHVFQYVPNHRYAVPVGWMVEVVRTQVRKNLAEAKEVLREAGVEAEVVMPEDAIPSHGILAFVQSCASPLLVMGTHAVVGMERFLLGSTAEEVLRQAPCPVVTVGAHAASKKEKPYPGKILYATDLSEASLAAVPYVVALRKAAGSQVRILHVSDPDSGVVEEGERFDRMRRLLGSNGEEEYVVLHGTNVAQAVVNEAERYPADLIILGVRRASAFVAHAAPKIAFQIIGGSPCPVLTVSS